MNSGGLAPEPTLLTMLLLKTLFHRHPGVQIPALPIPRCVAWDKQPDLSLGFTLLDCPQIAA